MYPYIIHKKVSVSLFSFAFRSAGGEGEEKQHMAIAVIDPYVSLISQFMCGSYDPLASVQNPKLFTENREFRINIPFRIQIRIPPSTKDGEKNPIFLAYMMTQMGFKLNVCIYSK